MLGFSEIFRYGGTAWLLCGSHHTASRMQGLTFAFRLNPYGPLRRTSLLGPLGSGAISLFLFLGRR